MLSFMVYCLCNRTLDKKRRNSLTKEINKEELLVQQEYIEKVKAINAKREQMPLAHVHSFGCQQNVSDGEKIKGMLAQMGYGFTPEKVFVLACKAFAQDFDKATVKKWLVTFYRRFFTQQFKRSCLPDGVKIGSICLSPRGDWRMPSDASSALWVKQAENLEIE